MTIPQMICHPLTRLRLLTQLKCISGHLFQRNENNEEKSSKGINEANFSQMKPEEQVRKSSEDT